MNLPCRPLSSNLTKPSIKANNVSSLPRPTFLPGFHFVPRWRAKMLPPSTRSPPNFFSPNRCDCESRPLRELPTPFLCAITQPRKLVSSQLSVVPYLWSVARFRLYPLALKATGNGLLTTDDGQF